MKVIVVLLGGRLVEVLEDHRDHRIIAESNYGEGADVLEALEDKGEWHGPESYNEIFIREVKE